MLQQIRIKVEGTPTDIVISLDQERTYDLKQNKIKAPV